MDTSGSAGFFLEWLRRSFCLMMLARLARRSGPHFEAGAIFYEETESLGARLAEPGVRFLRILYSVHSLLDSATPRWLLEGCSVVVVRLGCGKGF